MFLLYSGGSGSPIEARQTAPIFLIILILLSVIAVVVLVAFLFNKIEKYKKSDKYLEKEMNRKTKRNDVTRLIRENNLKPEDFDIIWEVCQLTQANNIKFLLKTNADVQDLFRNAYFIMKEIFLLMKK